MRKLNNRSFYSINDLGGDQSHDFFASAGFTPAPIDKADILIFNGGTDVATSMYGERPVRQYIPEKPSERDMFEKLLFDKWHGKKFLVGICRGSQFLNVMNGGTLWQDVTNHGHTHDMIVLDTGESLRATSTHHQMMRPNLKDGKLIAVAYEASMKHAQDGRYLVGRDTTLDEDAEIVWYPKTHSLCIQGHPEYVPGSPFATYCLDLINKCYEEVHAKAA